MNETTNKPKESIDTQWVLNRNLLEGSHGIQVLPNDNEDLMSRLLKALRDVDGLPNDMDNPASLEEAEAVNSYAVVLYHLFCEGSEIAEDMMIGKQVEKAFEDIQDEAGNTRCMYDETGHKRSQF